MVIIFPKNDLTKWLKLKIVKPSSYGPPKFKLQIQFYDTTVLTFK